MKILLLKGGSQYGALRNYIDQWNYVLSGMNHETYILDMASGITLDQLVYFIQSQRPQLVLACNAICGNAAEKAVAGFGKYVTVIYDNPVVHTERLSDLGKDSMVFSCDSIYAGYIKEHYPDIGRTGFLPLSGNGTKHFIPYEERAYDLIFTGSYFDVNHHYQTMMELPSGIKELAMDVAEEMLAAPSLVLWDSMDRVLQKWNVDMSPAEKKELLSVFRCIDIFVRAHMRDKVMRQVADGGISVHIFGNGWEKFQCRHKENLIFHEGYGDTALAALADSKLSLNIMPWFRAGIQERNIAAMLAKTVSVTDSSRYIDEYFTDREDIVLYSLEHLEKLPGIITECLENEEKSRKIAQKGYEKAVNGHTWKHRVEQLLEEIA